MTKYPLSILLVLIFIGCSTQSPTEFRVKINKPAEMDDFTARGIVLAVLANSYRFSEFTIREIPADWKEWCLENSKVILDLRRQCDAEYVVEPPYEKGSLSQFYIYEICENEQCKYVSGSETAIEE